MKCKANLYSFKNQNLIFQGCQKGPPWHTSIKNYFGINRVTHATPKEWFLRHLQCSIIKIQLSVSFLYLYHGFKILNVSLSFLDQNFYFKMQKKIFFQFCAICKKQDFKKSMTTSLQSFAISNHYLICNWVAIP